MKAFIIIVLLAGCANALSTERPAWWNALTEKQRAMCVAQGGCAVMSVEQIAKIVIEEAALLAAENESKTCRNSLLSARAGL